MPCSAGSADVLDNIDQTLMSFGSTCARRSCCSSKESSLSDQMVDPEKHGEKINLICRATCRNRGELVSEDCMYAVG